MKTPTLQLKRAFLPVLFILLLSVAGVTNALAHSFSVGDLNYSNDGNGSHMREMSSQREILDSDELTVYDDTVTSNYVPAYVFYFDDFTKSQYVIPAADLAAVNGGTITSVKFYTTDYNMPYTTVSTVDVYLKEVDYTTISAFEVKANCQVVYTGTLEFVAEGDGGACVITFSTPFDYNGGNLLVGCENTTDAGWKNIYFYGQTVTGASVAGYNASSLDNVVATQRNFIPKTTFYYTIGDLVPNLVASPNPIDLGHRPNGAWMRPLEVNIFNEGSETTINGVSVTNGYFQLNLENVTVPFVLSQNTGFDFNLSTVGTTLGEVNANLVINYGENEETQFDVIATAYTPVSPDVWELAPTVSSFPYTATLNANSIPLYDNYRLPPTNIIDGADAVYKLVFTEDTYLNASVTSGENGKVALYPEDFHGVGGPDLGNSYTRPQIGGSNVPFEALIGNMNSTTTSTYFPFHTLWNYSLAENLFLASELVEAGVTSAPMTSLSWYVSSTTCTTPQNNISIWMANVSESELTATSHITDGMTLVYTGENILPTIGWNEFEFNQGTFSWDGNSNVLIVCQRNNGSWQGSVSWQTHNPGFTGMCYAYNDNVAYNAINQTHSMYTSSTNRANIIMKSEIGRNNRNEILFADDFESGNLNNWTLVDADGDGDNWKIGTPASYSIGNAYSGDYCASSWSWNSYTMDPDQYMISPLVDGATSISYYVATNTNYPDHYAVMASTTSTNISDFITVFEEVAYRGSNNGGTRSSMTQVGTRAMSEWTYKTISLPAGTRYVAFRHYDSSDMNYLFIDDVTIISDGGGGNSNGFISNLTVTPGTYYLVASSTSNEFTVEINTDELPCPEMATNPRPLDAAMEVSTTVNLSWKLDSRATEYRLMFGTTYYCEETLVDWTDALSEHHLIHDLNNNTNYFWRIDQRNDNCPEGVIGQVWGFTTHLNVPLNLYADDFIFQGDNLMLSWDNPNDRSLLYYNVYQDGELIGSTYDTYYTISNLPYNINPGYYFNVTAVYNEGESNFSNTRWVRVTGEGTVEGYVYEQDGVTPIQGARVEFQGTGEISGSYWYYNYTDENGHYSFNMLAGTYTGIAMHSGYQNAQHGSFIITYNELTSNINFVMDELFNPVSEVVAEYYPDAENPESTYVKVYWGIDDLSNWLYYDDGVNVDAIGLTAGGSFYWGVMFPAGTFAGSSLKKVSMYDYSEHTGNIMVYQGGTTAPGSLLYTQPYTCTGSMDFVEWTLNMPVVINPSLPLWIVMNNNGGQYIASCCANTGDANGRWISLDGATWEDLADYGLNYTWMIRAYVTNGAKGEYVAPVGLVTDVAPTKVPARMRSEMPNGYGLFSISGSTTTHNVGVPSENVGNTRAFSHYRVYRTDAYNNGPFNLDNTVLIADEVIDTLLIDVTWPNVEMGVYKWGVGCVYVGNRGEEIETPIHWTEPMAVNNEKGNRDLTVDFESGLPTGWNVIDGNNDGLTWTLTSAIPGTWTYYANLSLDWYHGGSNAICSGSYINGYGAVTPDEYLVSPQVNLGVGSSISFWVAATDVSYPADHFGVFVSDDGTSGWTSVQEWTLSAEKSGLVGGGRASRDGNGFRLGTWYNYTVDLSAYDGPKYVAFRHFDCYDQYIMCLDDISIVEGSGLQEPRESGIVWSNWISKDMILGEGEVNITVTLNSEDSPAGTTISFVNLNSAEQQHYPMANITLDNTGYYAWDSFRKGYYQVTITKDGYETIIDNVSIWNATSLSYVMTEIIYSITDLYVSRTGWAKWDGHGEPLTPGSGGSDDSFEFGFENDFEGWTTIDNDGDSLNWVNSVNSVSASGYDYTGLAHGGDYFVYSQSYIDYDGAYNADNYLVSPQKYSIVNGSTLSFWADNANESYPDHFAIAIATVDIPGASDFVDVWNHTGAKLEGKAATRYTGNRYQNWRLHSVDLSAYAGQDVWIAFHHQDYDMYEIWIDDVTLTAGAKNGGNRHLEYYQVMCENLNHEPIFNINTPHNFCQVATDQLVEGEHYLCQVVAVYSTGMSAWSEPIEWEYEPCDHWGSVDNVVVYSNEQGNHIEWIFENGYNPYGGNKSSLESDPQPSDVWNDGSNYQMLKGGEFYSQYAEDGVMLNFFALDNVDLRAFLLYNLSDDNRFSLVPEEEYGQFILTSNVANNNFMDEFETFYQSTIADFSLLSKVDIADRMLTWKSSVAPTNYLSIMMDVITAKTRTENDHCLNSNPFCTSDVIEFESAYSGVGADENADFGCLYTTPNPSWYHMRIHTAGQFVIHMEGHDPVDPSILRDIDYCVWGPFTNPYMPCISDLTADKIIDCNYSAYYAEDVFMGYPENEHQHQVSHGTMNYHMPEIGEYYIMMITNYSNQPCNITFTKTEGVGETDCDIIYTTGIIGFLITEDDEFVTIASPDDRDYTVEGEFGEHEYCVRPIYPGEMHLPAQNYGWSMGCPQTASNDEEYHWNVDIHQYPYNMSVTGIIQINGVEQQTPTLEIGAFCGDECRGAQRLTYYPQVDRYLVFLTLYGDAGDVMSFRLYDHVAGQELDIACSSTISFVPDGFIGTAFDPYVFNFGNTMVEQVSNFAEGYNWWGTYIEQEGIDGLGMLEEGLGDNGVTIRSQVGFTDYYQGYGWYGSLSSINNESSYRVITSAPCTVTMTGNAAVPSQHPITLSQGWTWIGYVPSTAMSVDAAMAGVDAEQGDKMKSQQGYADYYPGYGWYGSLNTMEPGMGLMYYSVNGNPVPFTYPDSGRGGELKKNITAENNHWIPNVYAYPDNMTVMAIVELDDKELASDNYELAAFAANGECRGSVKLMYAEPLNRHVAFLTVSGKDAAELSFRLYDTETNEEYYDAEESLHFIANAMVGEANDLYVVHFRGMTDMDEFASRVKVYPNPVAPGERFSIGMNKDVKSPVRVEIVNALGAVVSVETTTQTPASIVAPFTAGVYTLRITVEGKGTAVRKLVVK